MSEDSQYFSKNPKTPHKIRKMFESVGHQSLILQTSSNVFSPDEIDKGTRILIENIMLPSEGPILDMGAGYGPISIWLHKHFYFQSQINSDAGEMPQIYASEVNERAIWLMKRNFVLNDCKDVKILKGDFVEQVKKLQDDEIQFKAVFTNPPLKTGHAKMLELFEGAMSLLAPDGYIQYVHKKKLGAPGFMNKLKDLHPEWHFRVIRKKGGFHVIVLSPVEFDSETPETDPYAGYF